MTDPGGPLHRPTHRLEIALPGNGWVDVAELMRHDLPAARHDAGPDVFPVGWIPAPVERHGGLLGALEHQPGAAGEPGRGAGGRCEWCGAANGEPHPVTGSRVVLTTAHVHDPDPMNCADSNLAALCQRCHLNHDRAHHIAKAKGRRRARKAAGDLFLGPDTGR